MSKKDGELGKDADKLTGDCAKLNAIIKLDIGGLQAMKHIRSEGPRKPQRDICS
jgi:hypothetical protein